jgi:hypothetical protein
MAGIALAVHAQEILLVNVVMAHVMLMKIVKHAKLTAACVANVKMVKYLTVMAAMNAGPKVGLVMVLQIVMINNMALI